MADYGKMLREVRRFTGDAFDAAHGYDARKPMSFGRRMAVLKYYRKLLELTSMGYQAYTPKRGEKTEAFNYTGQSGYRKFTKAIIRKASPEQHLEFHIDKSLPKGHRFVAKDRKTGRQYYSLPEHLFMADEDDPRVFEDTIREYAPDAEFFLITAGETYMWGAGGGAAAVSNKLIEIFRNYSATQFDAYDKNSSYYGNWFRGVVGFTNRFDILPEIGKARAARREYKRRFNIKDDKKYRNLLGYGPNGRRMYGVFENGKLLEMRESEPAKFESTPFDEGRNAFRRGQTLKDNPYMKGIASYRLWRAGWLATQREFS